MFLISQSRCGSEVMASAGKSQLLSFMDELIPTIRIALCDSSAEIRESAGMAFSTLYKSGGPQSVDEIIPTLLHALEDDETSDTTLDGLKQILSDFNAHALGALAEVAGPGLNPHLSTVLPTLICAMGDANVFFCQVINEHLTDSQINALCMAFYVRLEEARQTHYVHKLALGALALEDALSKLSVKRFRAWEQIVLYS